jgi:putative ATPase
MAAFQACQVIGMPECRINLAHLVAYLAEAPKSTRAYAAYNHAEEKAKADSIAPVPLQMRNAPTSLMKDLGYGKEYHYNPEYQWVLRVDRKDIEWLTIWFQTSSYEYVFAASVQE